MNDSIKKIMIITILSFMFVSVDVEAACLYDNKLNQYASYAQESMRETGIYASLILAQSIIESGLGSSSSAMGIKLSGVETVFKNDPDFSNKNAKNKSLCESKNGNWYATKEEKNGILYDAMACFKKTSDIADALRNQGRWLLNDWGNRKNIAKETTLLGQLHSLRNNPNAVYATDSEYVCKLINQINSCDLTKYDDGISYSDRGVTITGNHSSNLSNQNCSYSSVSNIDNNINNTDELEHFSTNYTGDLTKGWIYERFEFSETFDHQLPDYKAESNINDVIDVIFDRAKTVYISILGDGIISGPGLLSADSSGFMQRIGMPYIGAEGAQFYFSNMNLSFAGGFLGQCTWYAFGRANEMLSNAGSNLKWNIASNAGLWYRDNLNKGMSGFKSSNDYTKPKVGAIISWSNPGAPGHVAVVEKVEGDTVIISEANISSAKSSSNPYGWQTIPLSLSEINRRWGSYTFNGYIYTLD